MTDARTPVAELRLLALDVETTGLQPGTDRLLAVGFVPVDGLRVRLAGARRLVVGEDGGPGEAVVVHGLTHDDLAAGHPLPQVLEELREALAGRVLLAHHAPFDLAFLRAAYGAVGQDPPPLPVVCTLDLQRRLLARHGGHPAPGRLRLWGARAHFGLPAMRAHDALGDALACAELYLAQVAELGAPDALTFADVRRRDPLAHRVRRWLRTAWRRLRGRTVSAGSR